MMRPLLLVVLSALVGCTCEPLVGIRQDRFSCADDDQCDRGFFCNAGICDEDGTPRKDGGDDGREADAGVDAGSCVPTFEACADSADNDCDGLIDCADPSCATQACGANGQLCAAGVCGCPGGGGVAQAAETACADNADNDCDGIKDCEEPACAGVTCGSTAGLACRNGACQCSADAGVTLAEASCSDSADNDCDGLTDCADSSCNAQTCALNGFTCAGTTCACSGNGGTVEVAETLCVDGKDNDCDGFADCADSSCLNATCGPNGLRCGNGTCSCSGNGAAPQATELSCADALDNDCDGLTDCLDPHCGGKTCGAGKACSGTACVCAPSQGSELSCSDGLDNDCDGAFDCSDTSCAGLLCGTNGRVCSGTSCTCSGPGAEVPEATCNDGKDNDCDGLTDCFDSNCQRKACDSSRPAAVCCGGGNPCKDLSNDESNCGGCNMDCDSGRTCTPKTATLGSVTVNTGVCGCSSDSNCPAGQKCNGGQCECTTTNQCFSSSSGTNYVGKCTVVEGFAAPGICHY